MEDDKEVSICLLTHCCELNIILFDCITYEKLASYKTRLKPPFYKDVPIPSYDY